MRAILATIFASVVVEEGSGGVKFSERTADREPQPPAQIREAYDRFKGFIRQIIECETEDNVLSEIMA